MEMGQMKIRHAKETDVKSIIELQAHKRLVVKLQIAR